MAPPKKPWFRMYCEITGDRKLRGLPADQRWVWVAVMVLARTSPLPGFLMVSDTVACSDEAIADEAATPVAKTRAALMAMADLGMIHRDPTLGCWAVTNWERRQFESDDTTARTRKHRQKSGDATTMERSGNADGTHQTTETESELVTGCTETTDDSDSPSSVVVDALELIQMTARYMALELAKSTNGIRDHGAWVAGTARTIIAERPDDITRLLAEGMSPVQAAEFLTGTSRRDHLRVIQTRPACADPDCVNGNLVTDPTHADVRRHTQALPCPVCKPADAALHRTEEIAQ